MVTRRTVRPTAARSIWWPGLRRGVWVQTILRVSRVACWPGLLRFTRLSTNVEPYLDLSVGLGVTSDIRDIAPMLLAASTCSAIRPRPC
jgi:hypothetical protein